MDDAVGGKGAARRAAEASLRGARDGARTIWFLLKIIVPITFLVELLGWSGFLERLSTWLSPAMGLLGLPGGAALAFLSGALLNNYSAIAVAGSLGLGGREMTILAIMCLCAHNLLVETAVMRKSGSSALKMLAIRLGTALLAGWAFNLLLPDNLGVRALAAAAPGARPDFAHMTLAWLLSTARLSLKIVAIVLGIMVAQRLLEEFKAMDFLSKLFAPLMRIFGLGERASFLWIVINVVGYAYGAGIIVEQIESGRMKRQEGDLFNHHASVCHSLIEDTALFAAVGAAFVWITLPRFVLAIAVVWLERARRHYVRRSFRVGVG